MTRRFHPFTQPVPSAIQPDVEVVERQPKRRGGFLGRRAVEIHAMEHVVSLFWEAGQTAVHALAKHAHVATLEEVSEQRVFL
jgi:hypothetical protein